MTVKKLDEIKQVLTMQKLEQEASHMNRKQRRKWFRENKQSIHLVNKKHAEDTDHRTAL